MAIFHSPVFGKGWAQKKSKFHFFDETTISICGRATLGFLDTANHNPQEKQKCRICLRKLAAPNPPLNRTAGETGAEPDTTQSPPPVSGNVRTLC